MSQMYPIWPQIFTGIITWGPFTTLSTRASHGNQMDFGIISGAKISSDIARIYYVSLGRYETTSHKTLKKYKLFYSPFLPHLLSMSVNWSTIGLLGTYPYYKLAAIFFSVMLFRQLKKGRNGNPNGLPLPPGPKGYPLIGNIFDMPIYKPWFVYDEWRKTYGKTFIINGLLLQITGHFR